MRVEHLCKRFGEHVVLDDLTLEFPDGRITCLMGASGKGKTTEPLRSSRENRFSRPGRKLKATEGAAAPNSVMEKEQEAENGKEKIRHKE